MSHIQGLPYDHPEKRRLLSYIREMEGTTNEVYKEFLKQKKMAEDDKKVCEMVGFSKYKLF